MKKKLQRKIIIKFIFTMWLQYLRLMSEELYINIIILSFKYFVMTFPPFNANYSLYNYQNSVRFS